MSTLTKEQKETAKLELRTQLTAEKLNTLDLWIHIFRADDNARKTMGYSRGTDEMLKSLVRDHEAKMNKLMKAFDRGDFD